jgi:Zn-dependent M32 family carboxypeptidase
MIAPVEAVQREDYSDIEERKTNYETMMKDLDKPGLVRNISNIYNNTNSILSNSINIDTTTNTNSNTDNTVSNTNYNRPIQRKSTLRVYNYRNLNRNSNRFSMFKNTTRKLIFRR